MEFWTFGSLVGKRRKLAELQYDREAYESDLKLKIRTWKIAPKIIADIDEEIAKLERNIGKKK